MWRWNKRFISNRCSAEKFPWSLCQPPECIVDTTDIWNTLDVFYISFFRQWVAEIKLKKPSIFTCDFVSKFVARYWYKIVTTPFVLGTVFDFAKRSSRSAWTLTIYSWLTPKNVREGISLTHRSSIDWWLKIWSCRGLCKLPLTT